MTFRETFDINHYYYHYCYCTFVYKQVSNNFEKKGVNLSQPKKRKIDMFA